MAIRAIIGRNAPQWMLALATTQEGDVPLFLQPLDGNSSDKVTLASAVEALHEQLQAPGSDPSREKRGPRQPSHGRWTKPSAAGSKSSGISPTGILPVKP